MHTSLIANPYKWLFLLFVVGVLSFFSAYNHTVLFVLLGSAGFSILCILATNENHLKLVLPPYLLILLFQDTIVQVSASISPSSSALFNFLDEALLMIALFALMINFIMGKQVRGSVIFVVLSIILLLGIISSLKNGVPIVLSVQGAFLMTKGLLLLLIFMNIRFEKKDFHRLMKWVKGAAFAVLIFSFVDLAFTVPYRSFLNITHYDYPPRAGIESVVSLFVHPGLYGWFMVFVGIYFLVSLYVSKSWNHLFWANFFLLMSLFSFRFKTMLAIIAVLAILYLLIDCKKKLAALLPISIVLFMLYLLIGHYIIELTETTISSYVTADISDSARKALYLTAVQISEDNFPFGEGFGRFGGFVSRENYSPVYSEYGISHIYGLSPEYPMFITDTYWPNVLGETGIIGAALMLALHLYLISKLLWNYKRTLDKKVKVLLLFAALTLVQALVESLGEPIFNSSPQNIFLFITLGVAFSISNELAQDSKKVVEANFNARPSLYTVEKSGLRTDKESTPS